MSIDYDYEDELSRLMSKQIQIELDNEILTVLDQMILNFNDLPVAKPKPNKDGMACGKCKDFNNYAEPNQKDGTYRCYRCRNNI